MNALAQFVVRRSKLSLWGFVALVLISTVFGFQSFAGLKSGGYDDPGSDSAKVTQILSDTFNSKSA